MKQRAIAIVRVSSEAQAGPDRQGLPAQRRACERIAERHSLKILDFVELRGISGAVVADHPDFQAVLRRIESPEVGALIVADLDRLMRPEDPGHYAVFRTLRDTGTVLYTESGPRDFNSDRLLMMLESELGAMERNRIRERTKRGRDEKRRKGMRAEGLVGMPRGVTFDHETEEWSYVFPEAERVREAFRLFLEGVDNFREIHRRTGIGKESDASSSVGRVLRQPLYAGIYRVDRRWSNGRPVALGEDEVREYVVLDPPLISKSDFDRAQRLLLERKARRPAISDPDKRPGVYTGHLECALCGATVLYAKDTRSHGGYVCANRRPKRCTGGQVSHVAADPQLDETLGALLGHEDTLRRLIEESAQHAAERAASAPAETVRRISQLENQAARIRDAYVDGAFDLREMKKRGGAVEGELSLLRGLLERQNDDIELDSDAVLEVVDVFSSWGDLGRMDKRRLLRAFQIRIAVRKAARLKIHVDRVTIGVLEDAVIYN